MRLICILSEECREIVSLWAIIAVAADLGEDKEVLLAGVGVGMAFINTLVNLRPMALLTLMFLASLLSPPHLPIAMASTSADHHQQQQKQHMVAAVMVAYCRWALPHVIITNLTRLTTTMLMLMPPITSTPVQPRPTVTPARASFQALALLLLLLAFDIVFVFSLALGLGVKGVAMASWCCPFNHVLLNAAVAGEPYQIRLPTATTSSDDDDHDEEEGVERWRYNSLVVIAWLLLLLPLSPVSSVPAAVFMMRMASFLQTLSAALARCYSHLNVFAVCALGLAQGLLILGMQIALQKWLHYVAASADPYHLMLAVIQFCWDSGEAGPAWRVWAVATGIRSSACAYICHRRGHGHHGGTAAAAMAPVKLLCMCVVGVPVSVLSTFLLDHNHLDVVAGLCYGVAAEQISQAVALTLLMFRQPPAAEIPHHDDDAVDSKEAGSDVAGVSISIS